MTATWSAVGDDARVRALAGNGTREIDLRGRVAFPGFNDAHNLVVVVGQGRVHLTSLARGIGLGLAIGIPVSLPSIVTGGYPGRLTGLFGDPNGAGMLMVTMTPLVMGVVRGRWRWLVGLLGAGGVLLTFSRTSLLALAFVVVWMLVASRLSLWLGAAILGPVAVLVAGQAWPG